MNVLSVDIGGTSFRIGVVDGNGNLGRFDKVLTNSVFRTGNVLDDLSAMLKHMLHSHMRKPLPCEDAQIIFTDDEPGKSVIGGSVYAGRMLHNC